MVNDFDSSADTSIDTSGSDFSSSDGFDGSVDLGGIMNDCADAGDFSSGFSDIGSLMNDPAADEALALTDFHPDVESIADAPSQIESLMDEPADIASAMDAAGDAEAADAVTDLPQDIDYDAVFSGLDSYDFDGIDCCSDVDRLDSSLESFQNGTWENLSADEQKAAMSDLADYVKDVIGFDNPPQIMYYNDPVDGDYGGYSPDTNTLEINEHMLNDNSEAADTVAHELWHAYQHERAMNPQSAKDYQYQFGFDNYVRPDDDFTAYQDQLVEAEARAFAQQFKDRLSMKGRNI